MNIHLTNLMCNTNRSIIHRLLKFRATSPHGIIPLDLLLLFSSAAAIPLAIAQSNTHSSSQYAYGLDANFNPSITVIIVVLVCAFFFIGFFSIYVRHCTENSAASNSHPSAHSRSRRYTHGLDPSLLESFPIFAYSAVKDLRLGKEALECAVYINEFEDDETLRLLPKCDHVFHPECIDAWLSSQTTCPVCRANLIPKEVAGDTEQRSESVHSADEQNPTSELSEVQNQVSVGVEEDRGRYSQAVENLTLKQNQRAVGKFPRSHSTGHSLVQPGENCERYTLRLTEDVRKQIVTLKPTTSCLRGESSERGYRTGGEGSSRGRSYQDRLFGRSDRWVFTMTPPFLTKTGSVRLPKVDFDGDTTAEGMPKMFLTAVKTPFDCPAG